MNIMQRSVQQRSQIVDNIYSQHYSPLSRTQTLNTTEIVDVQCGKITLRKRRIEPGERKGQAIFPSCFHRNTYDRGSHDPANTKCTGVYFDNKRNYDCVASLPSYVCDDAYGWGWLLPRLMRVEAGHYGRWLYRENLTRLGHGAIAPIPEIRFLPTTTHTYPAHEMINSMLRQVEAYYGAHSRYAHIDILLSYLLWSLGHISARTLAVSPDLHNILCQYLDENTLSAFYSYPKAYLTELIFPVEWCESKQFIPSSVHNIGFSPHGKYALFTDPACGIDDLFLKASNYFLEMQGFSYSNAGIKAATIESYFYIPWAVFPIPWISEASRRDRALTRNNYTIVDEMCSYRAVNPPRYSMEYYTTPITKYQINPEPTISQEAA